MKKLLIMFLSISLQISAMGRDETNSADPSSTISTTKSLSAASRPRRIRDADSRAGFSPYSTASQLRIDQMLDPDVRPSPGDSVVSVQQAISNARRAEGLSPR